MCTQEQHTLARSLTCLSPCRPHPFSQVAGPALAGPASLPSTVWQRAAHHTLLHVFFTEPPHHRGEMPAGSLVYSRLALPEGRAHRAQRREGQGCVVSRPREQTPGCERASTTDLLRDLVFSTIFFLLLKNRKPFTFSSNKSS